jgi:hypothetical protein
MTLTEYTEWIEKFYARIYFTRKHSIWWNFVFTDTCNSKSSPDRLVQFLSFIKVKKSHYKPGQTQGFQEFKAPRFHDNRHMKVVRLSALTLQEIILVLISVRDWVDPRAIVWPEGLCQWKIPMTTSGMEPATFRLVAQCLNQLRHRVPHYYSSYVFKYHVACDLTYCWTVIENGYQCHGEWQKVAVGNYNVRNVPRTANWDKTLRNVDN